MGNTVFNGFMGREWAARQARVTQPPRVETESGAEAGAGAGAGGQMPDIRQFLSIAPPSDGGIGSKRDSSCL